jgi:hypothetical protein
VDIAGGRSDQVGELALGRFQRLVAHIIDQTNSKSLPGRTRRSFRPRFSRVRQSVYPVLSREPLTAEVDNAKQTPFELQQGSMARAATVGAGIAAPVNRLSDAPPANCQSPPGMAISDPAWAKSGQGRPKMQLLGRNS